MKLTQKKLYLVTINLGGWVHDKVTTLLRSESEYDEDGYDYWDKAGDYGFMADAKRKLGPKKDGGCWEFLFEHERDAQLFLDGAKAARDFVKKTWCA